MNLYTAVLALEVTANESRLAFGIGAKGGDFVIGGAAKVGHLSSEALGDCAGELFVSEFGVLFHCW